MDRMSDVELQALAALVSAETEGMRAMNQEREHRGESPAYMDKDFNETLSMQVLRSELEERGILR